MTAVAGTPAGAQLTERFAQAMQLAYQLHGEHRRKGRDVPYMAHLLSVTGIVLDHGGGEDEAIAALLHDAVEDQGGAATREVIRLQFGERVAALVDACSDTDVTPKPPWRARKEAFIASLRGASPSVRLIVMADKVHNVHSIIEDLRALGDELWTRFTGGREGTLWYYRSVFTALAEGERTPLLDELEAAVARLERVAARSP